MPILLSTNHLTFAKPALARSSSVKSRMTRVCCLARRINPRLPYGIYKRVSVEEQEVKMVSACSRSSLSCSSGLILVQFSCCFSLLSYRRHLLTQEVLRYTTCSFSISPICSQSFLLNLRLLQWGRNSSRFFTGQKAAATPSISTGSHIQRSTMAPGVQWMFLMWRRRCQILLPSKHIARAIGAVNFTTTQTKDWLKLCLSCLSGIACVQVLSAFCGG